jgi:hypothetical protein
MDDTEMISGVSGVVMMEFGEEPFCEDAKSYHLSPRSSTILLATLTEAKHETR